MRYTVEKTGACSSSTATKKRPGIRVRGGVLLSENGPPFRTAETGAWRVMGGVSAAPLGPGLR